MIKLRDKRDKVEVYATLEQGVTYLHLDYESEHEGPLYLQPPGSDCQFSFGWGHQEGLDGTETMTDEHGDRLFIKTSQGHPDVPERFLEPFCDNMSERTFTKVPVAVEFYSALSGAQMKREIDRVMLALDADLLPGTGLYMRLAAKPAETVNATEMALVLRDLEVDPRNVDLDEEGRGIAPPHPNQPTKEEGPDAGSYDPSRFRERPGHPMESWRYEVENEDTHLGYEEWVEARCEQAKADGKTFCPVCGADKDPGVDCDSALCEQRRASGHPEYPATCDDPSCCDQPDDKEVCRTCGARYDDGGDGFDGECPTCADKTDQELHPENYQDPAPTGGLGESDTDYDDRKAVGCVLAAAELLASGAAVSKVMKKKKKLEGLPQACRRISALLEHGAFINLRGGGE